MEKMTSLKKAMDAKAAKSGCSMAQSSRWAMHSSASRIACGWQGGEGKQEASSEPEDVEVW
jgi:hypothetical protein